MAARALRSPVVGAGGVTFVLADRDHRLAGVRLRPEIALSGGLDLTWSRGRWRLRLPLPDVDRLEYRLELADSDGDRALITDPGNPRLAPGAFGDKSEALFPGYREPDWLGWPAGGEEVEPLPEVAGRFRIGGLLWSPAGLPPGQPAPLLVVHDGPEYATLGALARYLGAAVGTGVVPPLRAALLGPGDRDGWYAANPGYARALCRRLLPALEPVAPATVRVGVGASLGALALLHAHRGFPGSFDGLVLQSGSFFTPELDPQERRFSGYRAVTGFVGQVHAARAAAAPVPVVVTCGTAEENFANNRLMAATLRRLGHPTRLLERRDGHNFTAWRDALHPNLADLVTHLVNSRAA